MKRRMIHTYVFEKLCLSSGMYLRGEKTAWTNHDAGSRINLYCKQFHKKSTQPTVEASRIFFLDVA